MHARPFLIGAISLSLQGECDVNSGVSDLCPPTSMESSIGVACTGRSSVLGAGTTVRTVRADADGGWIQYCTVNAYHITADGYADGVRTGDPDIWTSGHYFATPYYCNSDGFQWGGYIYDIKYYGYSGTYICGLYDVYNNPGENVFTYC